MQTAHPSEPPPPSGFARRAGFLRVAWQRLITPAIALADGETTIYARHIMRLMVVTGGLFVFMGILGHWANQYIHDTNYQPLRDVILPLLCVGITYVLAWRGHPRLSVWFLALASIPIIMLLSLPRSADDRSTLLYLYLMVVPITYASIFLNTRATIIITVISIIGARLAIEPYASPARDLYVLFALYLIIVALVIIMGTHIRGRIDAHRRRQLVESERLLRLVTSNLPGTIMVAGLDGRIQQVFSPDFKFYEIHFADIIGLHMLDSRLLGLAHPDEQARLQQAIENLIAHGTPANIEYRTLSAEGQHIWLSLSISQMLDEGGKPAALLIVGRNVDDRKHAEMEQAARERLQAELTREAEVGEMRMLLMRGLSHEFRTPLTVLQAASDLLKTHGDRMTAEQRAERFDRISSSVSHMMAMFDDVVRLVAMQGQLAHTTVTVNMADYVRAALRYWQAQHPDRAFVLNTRGDLAAYALPPSLFDPILERLVRNAVEYSPAGTPITLTLSHEDAALTLAVRDEGGTLLPGDVPHLFEAFHRGSDTQNLPGSGLGLYLAQTCATQWGGQITVEPLPGVSTTFILTVPDAARPHDPSPPLAPHSPADLPDNTSPTHDPDDPPPTLAAPARTYSTPPAL